MSHAKQKKITFEFPAEEYVFLKMACAKQGVSMKEFITKATIRSIEDYEDELDRESIATALKEIKENGTIDWELMEKKLGWDKL